jgi:hypothetical protein
VSNAGVVAYTETNDGDLVARDKLVSRPKREAGHYEVGTAQGIEQRGGWKCKSWKV